MISQKILLNINQFERERKKLCGTIQELQAQARNQQKELQVKKHELRACLDENTRLRLCQESAWSNVEEKTKEYTQELLRLKQQQDQLEKLGRQHQIALEENKRLYKQTETIRELKELIAHHDEASKNKDKQVQFILAENSALQLQATTQKTGDECCV